MKIEVHLQGGLRKIIDITPGATVGATIGRNVFNADGTLYVPPSSGGSSQLSITSWELILNIPPNVTALANTATTGLYVVTGSGTSATRTIVAGDGVDVSNGNGVVGNPVVSHANTSSVTDISASFTGGTVPDQISLTFDQFGHVLTRNITGRTLDHNDTGALQGGNSTERYHFTAAEHAGLLPWADEDPADYALITQTITNGDATHSPSGDAVFDALAGKLSVASNLSDIASVSVARTNLGLGTAATLDAGSAVGQVPLLSSSASLGTPHLPLAATPGAGRVGIAGTAGESDADAQAVFVFTANGSASVSGAAEKRLGIFFFNTSGTTSGNRGGFFGVNLKADNSNTLNTRLAISQDGVVRPGSDNVQSLGASSFRWSVVYAGTGAINTSDAREKTIRGPLTDAELAWSRDMAELSVMYQWNDAIAEKGGDARLHCSPTVQSVIASAEKHGLDPFRYGFVCYDKWDEQPEVWNEWSAKEEVRDEKGNVIQPAIEAGRELVQVYRPAGDRYSLRPSELQFFIARGQEERLRRLEALLNP